MEDVVVGQTDSPNASNSSNNKVLLQTTVIWPDLLLM